MNKSGNWGRSKGSWGWGGNERSGKSVSYVKQLRRIWFYSECDGKTRGFEEQQHALASVAKDRSDCRIDYRQKRAQASSRAISRSSGRCEMTKAWAGVVMGGVSRFGAEERPPKPYNQKPLISYFPSGSVSSNVDYYSAEHCLGNTDLRDFYFSCSSMLLETLFL